jgi:aminoglycoside phosphotransferase family enzyme
LPGIRPELATSDVLYDLAFLLMDLCRRGLHAEASLLFNRYCDMQGEGEGWPRCRCSFRCARRCARM